ncbi:MAG: hypothetical protein RMY34_30805 [Aulosira sp. DedQUE10]|nr:hypothetical protein [Aulosira sp. DedQUE10]
MRIWAVTVVLASSWLITGVIAAEPIKAVAASPQRETQQREENQPIIVNKAEFGVQRVDSQKKVTFIPTFRVPLQQGNKYGWQIQLKNYKGAVTWREILRLPKRPETWGVDTGQDLSISPDGKEAVTKRTQMTTDGMIKNFWTIAPGDPDGKYKIQVYIDDRLIGAFEFEIVPLNKPKSDSRI